ncbi:MAG: DNA alkylation repair protein [Bacillota bacterium]|jgi:3-methyladenine DNA glycosylase AlkD
MIKRFEIAAWTKKDYSDMLDYLNRSVDDDYRLFQSRLIPNIDNILGVRMPVLQEVAKEIAAGNWREFLLFAAEDTHEELVVRALVISRLKISRDVDLAQMQSLIGDFVPRITSWASCDTFCAGLKFTHKHQTEMWQFLQNYLTSFEEYELRFATVMLMNYFIDDQYIERLLQVFERIEHDGYYVKMAVAWALSVCYVKQRESTMTFLTHNHLDDFTYNKTLQKIIESRRVAETDKRLLRHMKRSSAKKDKKVCAV